MLQPLLLPDDAAPCTATFRLPCGGVAAAPSTPPPPLMGPLAASEAEGICPAAGCCAEGATAPLLGERPSMRDRKEPEEPSILLVELLLVLLLSVFGRGCVSVGGWWPEATSQCLLVGLGACLCWCSGNALRA